MIESGILSTHNDAARKWRCACPRPSHNRVRHGLREGWLTNACQRQVPLAHSRDLGKGTGCLVGRYVLVPNHVHLFASPGDGGFELDQWTGYWKRQFSRAFSAQGFAWHWQQWDTRMRTVKQYEEKWLYVTENPVRHGFVARANQWIYRGEVF